MRAEKLWIDGEAARTPGFTHRRVTGYWAEIKVEDIKAGDLYRFFQPEGVPDAIVNGVHQTRVALTDARPEPGPGGALVWRVRSAPVRGFTV